MAYERELLVGWRDIDGVGHMANTAYLDKAADTRMLYFAEQGYSWNEFFADGFSPVIFKDEVEYRREARAMETVRFTAELAGWSADASQFTVRHNVYRGETFLARVQQTGGFIDLRTRRLVVATPRFAEVMETLERPEDFVVLPSLVVKDAD